MTRRGNRRAGPRRAPGGRSRRGPSRRGYGRDVRRGGRRRAGGRWAAGRGLRAILLVGVVVAVLGLAAFLHGASPSPAVTVARHLVYTAPTANDAGFELPEEVVADLRAIGLRHERIAVSRVEADSTVTTTIVDLTPRAGSTPDGPVLKVTERAVAAIDLTIDAVVAFMNVPASAGGRALFAGLTKIEFTGAPVTIISPGLDLAPPLDFRELRWSTPPADVVATVRRAGEQPELHGAPVTFVVVPATGEQEQPREAQKTYRDAVWNAVLSAGDAGPVRFVEATGGDPTSSIAAPAVAVPALPDTPIGSVPDSRDANRTLCLIPTSTYFVFGEAILVDEARTVRDLRPCIVTALALDATFELDGWTSYEGPLRPDGSPALDSPANKALSDARVATIADLLVERMGVPRGAITRAVGHGNVGQPDPDPRSPANRLVVVAYRTG